MLVLLFLLLFPSSQFGHTPSAGRTSSNNGNLDSNKSMIGYVQKEHINDGCGCSASFKDDPTGRQIFSVVEDTWMNIDGQDVKLKLVKSVSVPRGEVKRGQRTTASYIAPGARITMVTLVTKGSSEENEGSDYVGTITVVKGSREQRVKIVQTCGC